MKNVALGLMFAATLIPSIAFGATSATPVAQCTFPPDHKIVDTDGMTVVGCIKDAAWQAAMATQSQVGIGIGDFPTYASGTSITDAHGITYDCPVWFDLTRCVNLTGTDAYKNTMRSLMTNLVTSYGSKAQASAEYPVFSGWIASL
jgi:hypothetical protein